MIQQYFFIMYPLGMSGAPLQNKEEEVVHRFDELKKWLPHIKALGCDAIYIGPLFESTTHGYDTKDYRMVDRRLGDNKDFKTFVAEAHQMGLRIVVDGVFNHTGREFFAFQENKKNRESSRYCGWYKGVNFGWNSPYNDGFGYEAWRNCFELVNLNLQNREVKDYLFDVIRFWIHEFDIDGIRLDCADCLDFDFMKEMRWMTGNEKQDFWLMGEVIHGDYARWANADVLHSVTNYELHKGLYSGHNDHNYFEIAHTIRRQFDENGGIYRGRVLYSFVDNHDVDRIYSKLNDKRHLRPVYTLLYTLPGVPSLYYGSEWGIEGRKADGGRSGTPPVSGAGGDGTASECAGPCRVSCISWNVQKRSTRCLQKALTELMLTNRQYAFARIKDQDAIIIAVNNDENPAELYVRFRCRRMSLTNLESKEVLRVENGRIRVQLPAGGSALLMPVRR